MKKKCNILQKMAEFMEYDFEFKKVLILSKQNIIMSIKFHDFFYIFLIVFH